MEVSSKEEFQILELEVNNNETVRDNFIMRKTEKIQTKIIVYGIKNNLGNDEIIESLEYQNKALKGTYLKAEFRMKTQRGADIIMSLDPES